MRKKDQRKSNGEIFAHKMMMKLTIVINLTNILQTTFYKQHFCQHSFAKKLQSQTITGKSCLLNDGEIDP